MAKIRFNSLVSKVEEIAVAELAKFKWPANVGLITNYVRIKDIQTKNTRKVVISLDFLHTTSFLGDNRNKCKITIVKGQKTGSLSQKEHEVIVESKHLTFLGAFETATAQMREKYDNVFIAFV